MGKVDLPTFSALILRLLIYVLFELLDDLQVLL